MKKKYQLTSEEFQAIQEVIGDVLHLWHYQFIEAKDENEGAIAMSKEIFFNALKGEFIIKE